LGYGGSPLRFDKTAAAGAIDLAVLGRYLEAA